MILYMIFMSYKDEQFSEINKSITLLETFLYLSNLLFNNKNTTSQKDIIMKFSN